MVNVSVYYAVSQFINVFIILINLYIDKQLIK